MKSILKSAATLCTLSALMLTPILSGGSANAEGLQQLTGKQGMSGHYLGAGVAGNANNGDDDGTVGGNFQGRYQFRNSPVSLRGAAFINNDAAALVPMLSLDVPVTNNANVYLGGGYSLITEKGESTALGNQDAFVVTTGVEAALRQNIVLFGDAKVGFDAYENSDDAALSFQVGAGYRF
ncbi:hypothetical protein [Phormidium sp. CCY1219]|uniref:hypothetical protein n=1 Tax=Phormidium sp. CCY1219 TaxID=2886104 RepID=UPI002D1E56A4|nr:hypothetical protein [Phormidium sp. CCY1219]MEB3829781.1 porin family protein [Phormidium sp. CCY1219]